MSRSMSRWLDQQASVRERRGLVRRPTARRAGEPGIDLASNDYLGLARDPRLAEAAADAARTWGTGATASRLVAGTTELHLLLEAELAAFVGMESALVFSSGYMANVGVLTALGGPGTLIVADEQCHASLVDGGRLSRSRVETFVHNDVDDAARRLESRSEPRAIIAVESIYSVGGDAAPLGRLLALAEEHDAVLLIDEAHSLGVAGSGRYQGRGAVAGTALAGNPHVVATATLSKALGSQGGAALGPAPLREHLVNRSRAFIFDTALAPTSAAAALAALRVAREEPWRSSRVLVNAAALVSGLSGRDGLAGPERLAGPEGLAGPAGFAGPEGLAGPAEFAGLQGLPGPEGLAHPAAGAVQSIAMPSADHAAAAARAAAEAGVRVGCFRPPSVPDGVSRLRLTAHAALTPADIGRAIAVLRGILEETA